MNSTLVLLGDETCVTSSLLPCSESISGSAFLLFAYGAMLALGSYAIASGGEELDSGSGLPPAFVGGLLLPILGAVPDAMVIIFSVVSATDETANSMLAVGMGTLAGSSAILLTLPWVIGVVLGRMQFTVTAVKSALSSGSSGAAANSGAAAAEHAAHAPRERR